jgi:hypothetical protein
MGDAQFYFAESLEMITGGFETSPTFCFVVKQCCSANRAKTQLAM